MTAGNDQHLRIWDTRHLLSISPKAAEMLTPPPSSPTEENGSKPPRLDTYPESSIEYDKIGQHMGTARGKGLLRANYQHGKSCSAAYWDPWGRRVLTTSYDDKLRGTILYIEKERTSRL